MPPRKERMDCFVANAPLRKRFAFVAGNDGVFYFANCLSINAVTKRGMAAVRSLVSRTR
jgi:hypothetical protein